MGAKKGVMSRKCANCESKNTICIYCEGGGSIIGAYFEDEFYCKDCKHYILYIEEYDSYIFFKFMIFIFFIDIIKITFVLPFKNYCE